MNAETSVKDRPILDYQEPVQIKSDAVVFWVLGAFGVVILSALLGMLAWVGAFSERL